MSIAQPLPETETRPAGQPVVNDFSITVATVNGSGSQTSNLTLMRAMFKMGIPVGGKNLFPSNIQGLPTWFTIRVNKDGFLARREEHEIVVAMNPESFEDDQKKLVPGGALYYADNIKLPIIRDDIVTYPMPVQQMVRDSGAPSSLRSYIANMVYVGVLAQMLGIDMDKIQQALDFHFKGKQKPIDLNCGVIRAAADWAAENLEKQDPYRVEPMDATKDMIMTDGNTAGALGAIYGGVQFVAWYPITPASSLAESLNEYLPQLRTDPETGKNTFAVVQVEDELAAIGMTIGAGWAGLRAMTSTSGPGISLMSEYAGLAYYTEVPIVVWDVQRVGPSTGLPTRTAQGDLSMIYYLGHGDTQHVVLLPGSPNECFQFGWKAFDYAERLQTPVFVLSDLDFGMNNWMTHPFKYPNTPMDRGKVLWEGDLERIVEKYGRYEDVDGDGIPYRTVAGNRHPRAAYFTRGTGHDEFANYSEDPEVWEKNSARLKQKFETARGFLPEPVVDTMEGAEVGIIAFGSTDMAVKEACHKLAQQGLKTDYMRIRALPFAKTVKEFINNHKKTYVVELNRDGQMHQLPTLEAPELATRIISLAHLDGMPLTARWVINAIQAKEEE